jgi:transcriptional regulator GlxA family with amidase domain
VRVEGARRKLELGGDGLDAISESCGFHSAEVMRRAFQRRLGIAPSDYRERFMTRAGRRRTAGRS